MSDILLTCQMLPGIEMSYSTPAPFYNVTIKIYTQKNTRIITKTVNFIFFFHTVVYFLPISIYFYDILE